MKLKGRLRNITNHRTGQVSQSYWPATREEAFEEGNAFYWPYGDLCDVPNHRGGTSIVYTVSNVKKCCAHDQATAAFQQARRDGEPLNPKEAREQGKSYYWDEWPGQYCGHVGKLTMDGKCWECKQARINSPRQQAVRSGATWYQPADGDTCPRGHSAPRRVSNGSCQQCEAEGRGLNSDKIDLREFVDSEFIISRSEALVIGSIVFRTGQPCKHGHKGWRYTSTGGCLTCMGR